MNGEFKICCHFKFVLNLDECYTHLCIICVYYIHSTIYATYEFFHLHKVLHEFGFILQNRYIIISRVEFLLYRKSFQDENQIKISSPSNCREFYHFVVVVVVWELCMHACMHAWDLEMYFRGWQLPIK